MTSSDLEDYVRVEDIADIFNGFVSQSDLDLYVKAEDILDVVRENGLEDYAKKEELEGLLSASDLDDYVRLDEIQEILEEEVFEKFVSQSDLDLYVKAEDLTNYVTFDDLNDYVRKEDLPDFNVFVREEDLADVVRTLDLEDYAKKEDIAGLVSQSDLEVYAKVEDVLNYLSEEDFAKKEDLVDFLTGSDLDGFVRVEDIADVVRVDALDLYVKSEDILDVVRVADLEDYIRLEELPAFLLESDLEDYVKVEELENYIPKSELENLASKSDLEGYVRTEDALEYLTASDLDGFALRSELPVVPENVSAFTNDAGYLTEHQDLTDYATKDYVNIAIASADYLTENDLPDFLMGSDLEDYVRVEDLEGYIPTSELQNLATKSDLEGYVKTEDAIEYLTASDLDDYLKVSELPTNVSEFTNDAGYLTDSDLDDYALKSDVPYEIIDFTGENRGVLTDEQLEKLMGNHCVVRYENRIYHKAYTGTNGFDYVYAGRTLTNDDVTYYYFTVTNVANKGYTFGTNVDARPRVVGNPEIGPQARVEPLEALRIGFDIYTIPDFLMASDLEDYVKVEDIQDFITEEALADLAAKSDLDGYVRTEDVVDFLTSSEAEDFFASKEELADYALKSEIPTVPTNVSAFTNDAGYLTEHQDISNKVDSEIDGANGTSKIYNETDGGGVMFEHQDGTVSFIGVDDGGSTGLAGQIYALELNDQDKYEGARIDITKDGMYYSVGDDVAGDRLVAANEIAVKGDIPTVPTTVSSFTNDAGYLTDSDLPDYLMDSDLDDYALRSELPVAGSFPADSDIDDSDAPIDGMATVQDVMDYVKAYFEKKKDELVEPDYLYTNGYRRGDTATELTDPLNAYEIVLDENDEFVIELLHKNEEDGWYDIEDPTGNYYGTYFKIILPNDYDVKVYLWDDMDNDYNDYEARIADPGYSLIAKDVTPDNTTYYYKDAVDGFLFSGAKSTIEATISQTYNNHLLKLVITKKNN